MGKRGKSAQRMLALAILTMSAFGLPQPVSQGKQDTDPKPPDGISFCGSADMDKYFNDVCGGAVAKIAAGCCDENPAPVSCDVYRKACIDAHIQRGECSDPKDCESGCNMFNSVAATCCPHVFGNRTGAGERRGALKMAVREDATPPGVFWDIPDAVPPPESNFPDDGQEHWDTDGHMHNLPSAAEVAETKEENFFCGNQASDDYFSDMCGLSRKDGHKIMNQCCPKEDMRIHISGSGVEEGRRSIQPPKVCEAFRDQCVKDHVAKGKCADEETCFLGNQSFQHVRAIRRQTDAHRPPRRGEASSIATPERACMGPVCCVRFCAAAVRQAPSRVKSPTRTPHGTRTPRHESRRGAPYVPALAY